MKNRRLLPELLGFAGVGALATLLQYGILIAMVEGLHVPVVVGSTVGFGVSAVLNYWLNYHYTFRSRNSHLYAASRFALIAGVGLAINALMMLFLGRLSWLPYLVAQVVTSLVVLAWNFLGNSRWSFAKELPK